MTRGAEGLLQRLVHPLRLAVRLRMEGRGEIQVGSHRTKQGLPELAGEAGVAIADQGLWEAMVPNYVIKEERRNFFRRGFLRGWDEMGHLR